MNSENEWLETDGLGGFASGTVSAPRSRRYHALLMRTVGSPAHRFVLVNGMDVHVRTPDNSYALSSQRYQPGVVAPDGSTRLESFERAPWPTWTFRLPCGRAVRQELCVPHGRAATVLTWTIEGDPAGCTLTVRPFLSGRNPHALQHENNAFRFATETSNRALIWRPYDGVPAIAISATGAYTHAPTWYRHFFYEAEHKRGLDDTEDLASPGTFALDFVAGEAVLLFTSPENEDELVAFGAETPREVAARWRAAELKRREALGSALHRAADAYIVRRGAGRTIIAGYPWFTDWGRDTFIALRGLCLATGRLDDARAILLEWAGLVSEGMLPNYFPDGGAVPEYNSVDASLWYIVAVWDYLAACKAVRRRIIRKDLERLHAAVDAILTGYARGTRFGIHADEDGLLFAGQHGVQLTWMDAKVGDWVVTPRIGKPVEVQALWINALRIGTEFNPAWRKLADLAQTSFNRRFWNAENDNLYDIIDVEFQPDRVDGSLRPNQIFAVGGLPFLLLGRERASSVVRAVEQELLTPLGLRTLSPVDPNYQPRYVGGVRERDGAYHQGTAWPWLIGPFVEAWLRVNGATAENMVEARRRFLEPLHAHLEVAGLGHVSEIADAEAPHTPRGCPFQAWSLGELIRIESLLA